MDMKGYQRLMAYSALREKSGLGGLFDNYTLEAYQTPDEWQAEIKAKAMQFIAEPMGKWFYIGGSVGSGKTHICTAIAGSLLEAGTAVKYMPWRDAVTKIKASVNDAEQYDILLQPLKAIKCLYIDDLFKGEPTPADLNLAFEILNARYNDRDLITLISSEKPLEELHRLDEAISSRIYERAKDYVITIRGRKNWRYRR